MADYQINPLDVVLLERAQQIEREARREYDDGRPGAVEGMRDAIMEQAILSLASRENG